MQAEEVVRELITVHELRKGSRYVVFVDTSSPVNLEVMRDMLEDASKGTVFLVGVHGKPSEVLHILDVGEVPGV